jgi:hypothetical protein
MLDQRVTASFSPAVNVRALDVAPDCASRRAFFGPASTDFELVFAWPAVDLLRETNLASTFELRFAADAAAVVRPSAAGPALAAVPTVAWTPELDWAAVQAAYTRDQVLLITGGARGLATVLPAHPLASLRRLYDSHAAAVKRSWTIESGSKTWTPETVFAMTATGTLPVNVDTTRPAHAEPSRKQRRLPAKAAKTPGNGWYVSFVVNGATAPDLLADTLAEFGGAAAPAFLGREGVTVEHTQNLWLFFGHNGGPASLNGRPEHTDKISHTGTWHVQVCSLDWFFLT